MRQYILRRLSLLPIVIFGITMLLFALLQFLTPEMRAALYVKDPKQLDAVESIIQKYHLRDPMPVQYWTWIKQIARGDLGYSETAKMPVAEALAAYFPATFELASLAFFAILISGVWLGVLSAVHKDKTLDHLTRFAAIIGYSLPSFVLGLGLLMVLYGKLKLFPPGRYSLDADLFIHSDQFRSYTGLLLLDSLVNGKLWIFWDALKHLLLPAATLWYISIALLLRTTRSSMLEVIHTDYIRTARAKGLDERTIIRKHALKNALIPTLTLATILYIGLLGGVVITETVFDFPGLGRWGVLAAQQLDIPAVMGFALMTSSFFVIGNLITDLLYAYIDPRIRLK
ncbi:MAG: ABC transporter permease [Elusimicrobia bacterium]|nr:ABC transporter permease [Elusimicrobiota bacterium]